jgi:hypothetical protein
VNLVFLIKDRNGHPRKAIPVRAIPLLTNWNFFSPDVVAQTLADDEVLRGFICGELQAFYLENDQVKPLKRGWWEGDAVRALRGLGEKIEHTGLPREAGYQRWREESLPLLPAGVFVWKEDLEKFHARNWDGRFRILASSVPTEVDGNGVNTPISRAHAAFINDGLTALEKWRELDFTTYIRPAMCAVVMEGMPDNQAETLVAATPSESRPADKAEAERKARMLEILERLKTIEYHDNEDALEHELDDAEASPAPVVAESASGGESTEQRQARRYQACIDAGLTMPNDDYSHLPRGIGALARVEGISRQSFSEDLKAHINRKNGR